MSGSLGATWHVSTVLLRGSECWTLTLAMTRKLHNAWMSFVRRALRLRFQHVRDLLLDNNALLQRLGVPSLHTLLLQRGCSWLGHVARMSPHRIPHALWHPQHPFSQQLNLVLSLITILVVLVCGCKASLVLEHLFGHAWRRTSLRGNIRSARVKLKLLADMVLCSQLRATSSGCCGS